MRVAREEIFGPVITMIPFDDEDEGIAIANDTEFGLYDYVFSKDGARALRAAKRLQAGHVGINTAQRNHDAPFGGFKMSGVGRDGGTSGCWPTPSPRPSSGPPERARARLQPVSSKADRFYR
jgi:phenylacetaldehyde dehydrogenase